VEIIVTYFHMKHQTDGNVAKDQLTR